MLNKHRKWLAVLAVVLSLAMISAACGDEDTPTPVPSTPTAVPSTPTPLPPGFTPPAATSTPIPPTPTSAPVPTSTPVAGAKPFEGQTLVTTAYSGPFADVIEQVIVPKFEADTGAKVEIVRTFGEEITTIAAAPADNPPYDVTVTCCSAFLQGIAEGLLLPLRTENIPNLSDLNAFHASDHGLGIDIGFGIPFEYGFFGIGYREDLLGFEPTTFADFWRPEAQGKIGLESINWWAWMSATAMVLDDEPGEDEIYGSPGQDAIVARLQDLDVALWAEAGAEMTAAMERGDVAIAYISVEILAPLVASDPEKFGFVIPPEGTAGFLDYFGVVRGTNKRDLAELYLNYLLDPVLQSQWAEEIAYWMSNSKVEYGPKASEVLPASNAGREAMAVFLDWGYILNNWDMFDQRVRREIMTQ